ncbi:hypothetical protein F4604DRAFT_1902289 [Suillus subluteus]|nr:hypothetical protein F4604DRAFT_1902289 [Suillus subluteus]
MAQLIRANQNAQTLVDMIQIGQWYGNKAVKSRPRKEPYRPTVKFRDIDRDLLRAVTTGAKPATNSDVDEDIHLSSPLLCDLISMVPVVGSQNAWVAQDKAPVSKKRAVDWLF